MSEVRNQSFDEELDYRLMWIILWNELAWSAREKVHSMDPLVVMGYMNFIRQIAEFDKKRAAGDS